MQQPCHYFAIGAMLNPVSTRLRNIHPLSSHPAKLLGHKIHFFGTMGMSECIKVEQQQTEQPVDDDDAKVRCSKFECSMHGVLHTISSEDMDTLDNIELGYDKMYVSVQLYDGTTINEAFVYCRHGNDIKRGPDFDHLPSERYLQILVEGAEHHGVDADYVSYLKSHDCDPRTKLEEFQSFLQHNDDNNAATPTTTLKEYSVDEVTAADGKDGREFLVTLNGKVLQPRCDYNLHIIQYWINGGMNHLELDTSRVLYDPKYGEPPDRLDDFIEEHCACLEDWLVRRLDNWTSSSDPLFGLKLDCVGTYHQKYRDSMCKIVCDETGMS